MLHAKNLGVPKQGCSIQEIFKVGNFSCEFMGFYGNKLGIKNMKVVWNFKVGETIF